MMSIDSSIEWTQATWNPVTGCRKISAGCKHCYAEKMAYRLERMGSARYANGFDPTLHDDLVDLPRSWRTPRTIFVNSMSDLFQAEVPLEFIQRVFKTMAETPRHTYQVLTKRADRLAQLAPELCWPENVWMGVSVESTRVMDRVTFLASTPAKVRFISAEPLLEGLPNLPLQGIHWVIVGGESGPGARPMEESWAQDLLQQCQAAGVAFFFKQWGGVIKSRRGRTLLGQTWDELPRVAAVRDAVAAK